MQNALTKEWYLELEKQSASNFINLPIEFQMRGYTYDEITNSYLNFFKSESNTRKDKLNLAKKFLSFIRSINKNRAKEELTTSFYKCLSYFFDNFSDLLSKQDYIHLETLSILTEGLDKTNFIQDAISLPDLERRVNNLKQVQEKEEIIALEWSEFEQNYRITQES